MCVSMRLKVLCLKVKSRIARTIWSDGQFVGTRYLYFSMK